MLLYVDGHSFTMCAMHHNLQSRPIVCSRNGQLDMFFEPYNDPTPTCLYKYTKRHSDAFQHRI